MSTTVTVEYHGGKKLSATIEGLTVQVDQSPEDGGEGTAQDPVQLFLSAIGTCAGTNAFLFCKKRNISTDDIRFTMFCEYDTNEQRYTKLTTRVALPDDFPEEHREGLIRVIDRCFVKKHILNPPAFETELV